MINVRLCEASIFLCEAETFLLKFSSVARWRLQSVLNESLRQADIQVLRDLNI